MSIFRVQREQKQLGFPQRDTDMGGSEGYEDPGAVSRGEEPERKISQEMSCVIGSVIRRRTRQRN